MNKKVFYLGAASVSLAILGSLWVQSKGGMINVLNVPPTVTALKASPLFTLADIKQDGWGDYLVLKSPFVANVSPPRNIKTFEFVTPGDAFTAVATDSTGQKWNLQWGIREGDSHVAYHDKYRPDDLLYIWRPNSCPPDVSWYDVTVKSKWGQSATWRVSNLQVARHYGQDEAMNPSFKFNGMTISGVAERFFATNSSPKSLTLHPRFLVHGVSADGGDWRVQLSSCTREWENPTRVLSSGSIWQTIKPDKYGTPVGPWPFWDEHYPQRNHYVRATGEFGLFQEGQIQRTVPFILKVPIVFKTYKPTPTPSPAKKQ